VTHESAPHHEHDRTMARWLLPLAGVLGFLGGVTIGTAADQISIARMMYLTGVALMLAAGGALLFGLSDRRHHERHVEVMSRLAELGAGVDLGYAAATRDLTGSTVTSMNGQGRQRTPRRS
jgi:hypothetical protein